jgi:leucyl-tRNA synthetase
VIQVDGKVRDKVEVPAGISQDEALAAARESERARAAVGEREVVREIVRAPRLVNLVTKR